SITASHNPQEWNGLKFMNSEGIFLDVSENKRLVKMLGKKDNYVLPYNIRQVEYYPDFLNYHIQKVLNLRSVNTKAIKARKFKTVVDCVNASGSVIIPSLLRELGCQVIEINCDGSGIFGRKPEPLPENLNTVSSEVKKRKADMGIVVDPDADRLVIITDEGKPFGEENTITTAVRRIMKSSRKNKTAVVNLSTSRSVDDIVKASGGRLFKSPVGEVNVIRKMKEVDAVIGGEGSGGVILPELHYARDSLAGIGLLLSEFAEFDGKVSDYKRTLPEYYIKKSVLKLDGSKLRSVFSFLKKKYRKYPKNDEDGLRIDFPDGWVNFRKSNTEPVIRIIVETKSRIKSGELSKIFLKELMSLK
ncbi:MAG: phosphoglucosamine mutase, partial [Ignavibacteria bacterium]|nr:phosphoglucosamine mutase [Ignavibacteria bacterium]